MIRTTDNKHALLHSCCTAHRTNRNPLNRQTDRQPLYSAYDAQCHEHFSLWTVDETLQFYIIFWPIKLNSLLAVLMLLVY